MKRFQKVLKNIFKIWLIYVAVCLVLPPLYHKLPAKEIKVYEENRDMDGQERVLSIDNNMDALLWRLRLIESAKETIVLATFDFRDDNSGQDMMSVLFNAADRGVKVRILVDGINGTLRLTGRRNF